MALKKNCEAYNTKVSTVLGFRGSITARWSDIYKHADKSLFAVMAHGSITPTDGSTLELVDMITDGWYKVIEFN